VIAERLKKVRSFIWLIQSKIGIVLLADIAGVDVEFAKETNFAEPTSIAMHLRILIGESIFC
jgi:hypothetical protein